MGLERTCRGWCVIHQGRACSGLRLPAVWPWMPRAGDALVLALLTPESALVEHSCSPAGGQPWDSLLTPKPCWTGGCRGLALPREHCLEWAGVRACGATFPGRNVGAQSTGCECGCETLSCLNPFQTSLSPTRGKGTSALPPSQ